MERLRHPAEGQTQETDRNLGDSRSGRDFVGEQVFRQIAEIPEDKDFELFAFQKDFFSHINPAPRPVFLKRSSAKNNAISVTGLLVVTTDEAQPRNFVYDREYQQLAHQASLENIAERSKSWNDFSENLRTENSQWQDNFVKFLFKKFEEERYQNAKFKTINDIKQYHYISGFEKDKMINDFAIDQHLMTEEDIREFSKVRGHCNYGMLADTIYKENKERVRQLNKERPGDGPFIKKSLTEQFRNLYKALGLEAVENLRANPTEDSEFIIKALSKETGSKDLEKLFAGETSQEIINTIENNLSSGILGKAIVGGRDLIEKYKLNCRTFFGSAFQKHAVAEKRWKEQHDNAYQKDLDEYLREKAGPEKRARDMAFDIKTKVLEYALGRDEPMAEIFLLPTGVVAKSPSESFSALALSPDEPNLISRFSELEKDAWIYAWSRYDTKSLADKNIAFCKKLNEHFVQKIEKNPEFLSEDEKETYKLLNSYGILIPEPINAPNGTFNASPAFYHEQLMEILPIIGGFVNSLSVNQLLGKDKTLSDIREAIIGFFGGDTAGASSFLISEGPTLNVAAFAELINGDMDNTGKVINYTVLELARTIYTGLSKDLLREFVELAGDTLDVSEAAFTSAVHHRVPNRNSRRALMCRVIFSRAFKKYLQGDGEPKYKAFFDRLQDEYKAPQLPDGRALYWE